MLQARAMGFVGQSGYAYTFQPADDLEDLWSGDILLRAVDTHIVTQG